MLASNHIDLLLNPFTTKGGKANMRGIVIITVDNPAKVNIVAILDTGLCQSALAIVGAIATIGAAPKIPSKTETIAA